MIPALRQRYNAAFTEARYAAFLADLNQAAYWPVDFRVAESPLFLDGPTTRALVTAGTSIAQQLTTAAFQAHSYVAIPMGYEVPGQNLWPHFLAVDFALCRDPAGGILPQLIELQGFPTVACWQILLARTYRKHFPEIPADFTSFPDGLDEAGCLAVLRDAILGAHAAENVVLLEIQPEQQKTRVDFACTEAMLGVRPVCVTQVRKRGRRLYYERDGREVPIHRIFNRVIFDELARKSPKMEFSFGELLDVEWAGHPNWYFRISKHTLPFLQGPHVPPCHFVSSLRPGSRGEFVEPARGEPVDLENYVLKPLYSFAGLGVDLAPTREKITALEKPGEWLLQRKVTYAPVMETPDGPAKAEVRLIFAGNGSAMPRPVHQLVRLTKGAMHGVDFNKGRTWVGASVGFHPVSC
jgi:hypothetical protein